LLIHLTGTSCPFRRESPLKDRYRKRKHAKKLKQRKFLRQYTPKCISTQGGSGSHQASGNPEGASCFTVRKWRLLDCGPDAQFVRFDPRTAHQPPRKGANERVCGRLVVRLVRPALTCFALRSWKSCLLWSQILRTYSPTSDHRTVARDGLPGNSLSLPVKTYLGIEPRPREPSLRHPAVFVVM